MSLSPAQQKVAEAFAKLGGDLVDPPAVMPAGVPLELSGEAVRSRLCVFSDQQGDEHALRPDLTLAVALDEAEARRGGVSGETLRRYAARAYRLPVKGVSPLEFVQVGFERFGAPNSPEVDATLFACVLDGARAGGAVEAEAWFGDLSIFPAFVDALDIAPVAAAALKRAFRQAGGAQSLLDAGDNGVKAGLADRLEGATREKAEAIIMDVLELSGTPMIGSRSVAEIADGLLAKAEAAKAGGIAEEARAVLTRVLAVKGPVEDALGQLNSIADQAGLSAVRPALDRLQRRMQAILETGNGFLANARFGTPFGRRFNYYDGFVFELIAPGADETQPFAAGGRYDHLLSQLSGGAVDATALGGVVRAERIEAAS